MKIQLSFIILRKISENPVHFSQFKDTYTHKNHKYSQILRYLCNIAFFCKFVNISNSVVFKYFFNNINF